MHRCRWPSSSARWPRLYPGRVDWGSGRAPGTDQAATRALRRYYQSADEFPNDVVELLQYFEPVQPGQQVRAVPGAGLELEVWILGSSLFGAQLAAALGLPYAFASHFAPDKLEQAIAHLSTDVPAVGSPVASRT